MRKILFLVFLTLVAFGCKKATPKMSGCDITRIKESNAQKVNITEGIWGTVANMEGNCMPMIDGSGSCTVCPAKTLVKIYQYTLPEDAVRSEDRPYFYEIIGTKLIAEAETDEDGFYQIEIPTGNYSVVLVMDDRLYVDIWDGQGALRPIDYEGVLKQLDFTTTYKAVF